MRPNARIGVPIARTLGNIVSLRNVARVGDLIGLDAAKALLITGQLLDAGEALRAGFLTEVVDDDGRRCSRARRRRPSRSPVWRR